MLDSAAVQPARIVLVEDNPGDVLLLRHALDEVNEPYTLDVLQDGEAAIHYIRQQCGPGPDPCLIVLDLHLPRHDGTAVLRAIRSEPELAHVRVVALTTLASPAQEAEVRSLGVDLYRHKPTGIDDFVALARELMNLCQLPARQSVAG